MMDRSTRMAAVLAATAGTLVAPAAAGMRAQHQAGAQTRESYVDKNPVQDKPFRVEFSARETAGGVKYNTAQRFYDATNPQDREALDFEVDALRRAAGGRNSVDSIQNLIDRPHVLRAAAAANDAGSILWVDAKGQFVGLDGKLRLPNGELKDPNRDHSAQSWNLQGAGVEELLKQFRASGFNSVYLKSTDIAGGSFMIVGMVADPDGKTRSMHMPIELDLRAFRDGLSRAERSRALDNRNNLMPGVRQNLLADIAHAGLQHAARQPIRPPAGPEVTTAINERVRKVQERGLPPTVTAPLTDVDIVVDTNNFQITNGKHGAEFSGDVTIRIDADRQRTFIITAECPTNSGTYEVLFDDVRAHIVDAPGIDASSTVSYVAPEGIARNAEIMVTTLSVGPNPGMHDLIVTARLRGPAPSGLAAEGAGPLIIKVRDTADLSHSSYTKDGIVTAPAPAADPEKSPTEQPPEAGLEGRLRSLPK